MTAQRMPGVAQPRTPAQCPGALKPPHHTRKRRERPPGGARAALVGEGGKASTGLQPGSGPGWEQDGAVPLQRQARPRATRHIPPGTNRPVGEAHDPAGEPAAGKPHGGFGERGAETRPCAGLRHRHDARASRESGRRTATPPRYSRRAAPRLYISGKLRFTGFGQMRSEVKKHIICLTVEEQEICDATIERLKGGSQQNREAPRPEALDHRFRLHSRPTPV